jgi:hypothetical protein
MSNTTNILNKNKKTFTNLFFFYFFFFAEKWLWERKEIYSFVKIEQHKPNKIPHSLDSGSFGWQIDEDRSEIRYLIWFAGTRDSSNYRTQFALYPSLIQ